MTIITGALCASTGLSSRRLAENGDNDEERDHLFAPLKLLRLMLSCKSFASDRSVVMADTKPGVVCLFRFVICCFVMGRRLL